MPLKLEACVTWLNTFLWVPLSSIKWQVLEVRSLCFWNCSLQIIEETTTPNVTRSPNIYICGNSWDMFKQVIYVNFLREKKKGDVWTTVVSLFWGEAFLFACLMQDTCTHTDNPNRKLCFLHQFELFQQVSFHYSEWCGGWFKLKAHEFWFVCNFGKVKWRYFFHPYGNVNMSVCIIATMVWGYDSWYKRE